MMSWKGSVMIFAAQTSPVCTSRMKNSWTVRNRSPPIPPANVAMIAPQDYPHFVRLLDACHLVLTDSGGIQEEAPSFGKPVLVMRETTERPEGVSAGTAKLIGADEARIVSEVFTLLDDSSAYAAMARAHNPFGDGRSSRRIVEVMLRDAGSAA